MIAVVMGVSGSGKTTVARDLAKALGGVFQEGDDLHPARNIAKMRRGLPLSDADRQPWLNRIARVIEGWRRRGKTGVVACSALRRAYRRRIIGHHADTALVYLRGSYPVIRGRSARRRGHFMPIGLLESQFATLEEPKSDERPILVGIDGSPRDIVQEILRRLRSTGRLEGADDDASFSG